MLRTKLSFTLLGVASLGLSASALAEHHETGNLKVGVEYNAGLTYDDHGLQDTKANKKDPTTTTAIGLNAANVSASGEAAKDVHFAMRYDMLGNMVELAHADWKHSDMLTFEIGRDKANQGGYANKVEGYARIAPANSYLSNLAFDQYSDMIAVHVALAGELTVQFVNDKKYSSTTSGTTTTVMNDGRKNTEEKNPAFNLEWTGDFSGWAPLVQVGSYDLNHSMYFTLGVKGAVAGVGLWADYTSDSREKFFRSAAGAVGKETTTDTLNAMNLNVNYALSGFTPWLEYSSYDVKDGTNKKTAVTKEPEANPAGTAFTDNGTAITLGATCNAMGSGYEPYLAVVSQSGKFYDAAGKTETLSNMMLKFGVMGTF